MSEVEALVGKFQNLEIEPPQLPKGKRTAYAFFTKDFSEQKKKKGLAFNGIGNLAKECSKVWKQMSEKDKVKYQRKAQEDAKRYDKEISEYEEKKRKFDRQLDIIHDKGGLKTLESISIRNRRVSISVTDNVLKRLYQERKVAQQVTSSEEDDDEEEEIEQEEEEENADNTRDQYDKGQSGEDLDETRVGEENVEEEDEQTEEEDEQTEEEDDDEGEDNEDEQTEESNEDDDEDDNNDNESDVSLDEQEDNNNKLKRGINQKAISKRLFEK